MSEKAVPDKPLFSPSDVLQSSNETIYDNSASLAKQFAVLGYTDTAAILVGNLNRHDWYHGRHGVTRPLHVLWDHVNHWPEGELNRVRESIQDERKRAAEKKVTDEQGEETGKKMRLEINGSPITDEDVKKDVDDLYYSYSKSWWYPERPITWASKGVHVPPGPHDRDVELSNEQMEKKMRDLISAVREAQKPQTKWDPTKGKEPVDSSAALVSALDLRVKLREKGDGTCTPDEREILEMIAKRLNGQSASHQIEKLLQSRHALPMLRDGALLEILGIDKAKVDDFAEQIVDTITKRLEQGRQPPPNLPIQELVQRIDTNTLTNPDSIAYIGEGGVEVPSTILHPPAPQSLILETEKRLDTRLPDDYKEYLSITNGNDAAWGGIINEAPLWKCEDIRWFRDDEDYFSDTCVDIPAEMYSIMDTISDDTFDWPKIGRSIIIGEEDVDNLFLIAPATVEAVKEKVKSILESEDENVTQEVKESVRRSVDGFAGSMREFQELEWCCVAFSGGGGAGMEGYKSFKAYLRDVAEKGRKKERDAWNLDHREFFGSLLVGEESSKG